MRGQGVALALTAKCACAQSRDLLRMEGLVLQSLEFRVNTPTCYTFLSLLIQHLGMVPATAALSIYLLVHPPVHFYTVTLPACCQSAAPPQHACTHDVMRWTCESVLGVRRMRCAQACAGRRVPAACWKMPRCLPATGALHAGVRADGIPGAREGRGRLPAGLRLRRHRRRHLGRGGPGVLPVLAACLLLKPEGFLPALHSPCLAIITPSCMQRAVPLKQGQMFPVKQSHPYRCDAGAAAPQQGGPARLLRRHAERAPGGLQRAGRGRRGCLPLHGRQGQVPRLRLALRVPRHPAREPPRRPV